MRISKPWRKAVGVLVAAVLLGAGQAGTAGAVTTVEGDPANNAYTAEPLRVMTWNVCGEAGGADPSEDGYCPERNKKTTVPDGSTRLAKAVEIADLVRREKLDAVLLQEVCAGSTKATVDDPDHPGDPSDASQLDQIIGLLGANEWSAVSAPVMRPPTSTKPASSACRGVLTGDVGVAVLVRGKIDWSRQTDLPLAPEHGTGKVLCAGVAGWETHLCTTHVFNNFDRRTPEADAQANTAYKAEIDTVAAQVDDFRQVVLGGDFNTRQKDLLQPLFGSLAECDQRAYHPGDTADEITKITNKWVVDPTDPEKHFFQDAASSTQSKIDYLFATAGFGACDSLTDQVDTADYARTAQPGCTKATPSGCVPSAPSDHAPLVGSVKGGPRLDWRLAGPTGHTGTASAGVGWTDDHGGAAVLDGSSGQITAAGPAVDTTRSFTVSAWAKVDPGAGTSVVLAQDGVTISGMMLWYNQPDSTWRFALPKADSGGWSVDQVISKTPAVPGRWTQLTGTFDAVTGTVTLYVDGVAAGTASHPVTWPATGAFVVGRDKVSGRPNGFWKGSLQAVKVYDYPMTSAQAASAAGSLTAPTATATLPATGTKGPGCHVGSYSAGDFGAVPTTTPELTAYVSHPDPSREVWAEFSLWDNSDSTQPVRLGGDNSASGKVFGSGTVSIRPPAPLTPGHKYGWYVRTVDGRSSPSPMAAVCHFTVA